jgi:ABC-type microcin C transport system permease subunit YejE
LGVPLGTPGAASEVVADAIIIIVIVIVIAIAVTTLRLFFPWHARTVCGYYSGTTQALSASPRISSATMQYLLTPYFHILGLKVKR